jgi:hypothetical protein
VALTDLGVAALGFGMHLNSSEISDFGSDLGEYADKQNDDEP